MRASCRPVVVAAALAATLAGAACGGPSSPADAPPPPVVDPATAAAVSGRVRFSGERPAPEIVRLDADRQCVSLVGAAEQAVEPIRLGADNALADVFVYVKTGLDGRRFPIPATPVVIDQHQCRYVPHVVGVRVGQAVEIRNGDPLLHNVRSDGAINQPFNQGQPVQGMQFTHTFTTREVMVPLRCDVHAWMSAFIGAVEHPYFAVTGSDGTFTLPNLPPGTYTLEAWHERLGLQTTQVALAPKESKDVEFTFAR